MILSAPAGNRHEDFFLDARRAFQNGSRHLDLFVVGEIAHDLSRCIGDVGKPLGKLGPGAPLDVAREAQDDLVEYPHMGLVEARRLAQKESGHRPQGLEAADGILAADGVFDLIDERDESHERTSGGRK
jgi:hypothetical protein